MRWSCLTWPSTRPASRRSSPSTAQKAPGMPTPRWDALHVRPVLNLKLDKDVRTMRAIAEEAFDLVLKYKGSHSGEHGDGLVRSEFHEKMFGTANDQRLWRGQTAASTPQACSTPARLSTRPEMDDRTLVPLSAGLSALPNLTPPLDWSAWPDAGGGFQGAVEMCNNNGACRKLVRRRPCVRPIAQPATNGTPPGAAPTVCAWPSPAS